MTKPHRPKKANKTPAKAAPTEDIARLNPADYDWSRLGDLGIEADAFQSVCAKNFSTTLVFCHPKALQENPRRVVWYRGLALLSRKEVSDLVGVTLKKIEDDDQPGRLREESASKLARLFNATSQAHS